MIHNLRGSSEHDYRPWLDGVRAVAILFVILEHLGVLNWTAWTLGGTGVGIFFALSGYLITGLLLNELERSNTIQLRRFYVRRIARLAPALLLMLFVCDLFFLGLGAKREVFNSLFAATYLTNYGTILRGRHLEGYGHTWSLAVEEHFYLIWPLVMLLMSRRFNVRGMLKITLAICFGVLIWRALLATILTEDRMLYVGSIERADALLYGCAGAMLVRLGWRPPKFLFYVGVVLIAIYLTQRVPWNAMNSGVLAIGSTLVLMCLDHCDLRVRRVLSFAPFVWVGVMSYGIYLWHGPLLKIGNRFGLTSLAAHLAIVALTGLIAYCSYRFFETPIRAYVRSRERQTPATEHPIAQLTPEQRVEVR